MATALIDKKHIGKQLAPFRAQASAHQLRFFAKAIGEDDSVYFDESVARDAGHPALPLPPTFLFSLEFEQPSASWRAEMGIDVSRILHGEQQSVDTGHAHPLPSFSQHRG